MYGFCFHGSDGDGGERAYDENCRII